MDKIIIIFSLFILSPLTNAQSYDDNFCDDLTFGSDETLYELNRLENIFNIAPKKLLFDDEYDNFTAETIKMYRYINEKNTLFELYSCAALERYKFAKKLIYAATFVHEQINEVKITENVAIDASLFSNALIHDQEDNIHFYFKAYLDLSPSYLREVMYVVIYESQHNTELNWALVKYHDLFMQYEAFLIQSPENQSHLSLTHQFVLLAFFDMKEHLIHCYKEIVLVESADEFQLKNTALVEWLVKQSSDLDGDFIYPFFLELEPYLVEFKSEFILSKGFVEKFIKESRNEILD